MRGFKFFYPLTEGIIQSRPNRFIMNVLAKDIIYECHCPSTGRIGTIDFTAIPCLFSEIAPAKGRRTKYTVEAISLDAPSKKNKTWIGINQSKINDYMEYFMINGHLKEIIPKPTNIKREVKLGKSRIDFLVDHSYIEIKTFLDSVPVYPNTKTKIVREFISFERVTQHYLDLANSNSPSKLILCFMYNREPLKNIFLPQYNEPLKEIIIYATQKGVETWQVNLEINKFQIQVNKCLLISN